METKPKPSGDRSWTEPESAASVENPPKPPYNNITQTPSGHMFEMDDTNSRERVRLQHRTGTFIEMHPNGDEVHKVYGDGYEITIKNKNILVKGHCSLTVEGDCIVDIKGDKVEQVAGNYSVVVGGSYNVFGTKSINLATTGDFTLGAGSTTGGGDIYLTTANHVYVSADMTVAGGFIADMITSTTRVDATTGVSAGPLGFVSTTGGLSIGIPAAVPFQINCVGPINSLASVSAPVGTLSFMTAIHMTDIINLCINNIHNHPTPKGPSGPPLIQMI